MLQSISMASMVPVSLLVLIAIAKSVPSILLRAMVGSVVVDKVLTSRLAFAPRRGGLPPPYRVSHRLDTLDRK